MQTNKKNNYKSNFLAKVILRFDFEQAQLGQLQEIQQGVEFKRQFPVSKEEKGEEGMIGIDFLTKEVKKVSDQITIWRFSNEKNTKRLKIHPKFLVIEYDEYDNSDELMSDAKIVLGLLSKFSIKTINRLGLRYINEIEIKDDNDFLNWNNYIADCLLGSLEFASKNKKSLARAMSLAVFKENDNNTSFNYGIWNGNYPNEINEKFFILDFDVVSKYAIEVTTDLLELIKKYNQQIEDLFEASIKESLRKILRKKA
jgi:uncharacterized protein (TIGR04255 family)